VLDDGNGTAVGYCIGCPDVPSFVERYDSYITNVLDPSPVIQRPSNLTTRVPWLDPSTNLVSETALSQLAYNPQFLVIDGNEDVLAEHKGTMHIDLLPEWQGKGWGRQLIEKFFASAKAEGCEGVWIGVAGDNSKVVAFYEKMGYRLWEREGKKAGSITMVKRL
jgi:hypothetical protein